MKELYNKQGITIKQLKELVKDLPETDSSGDDFELWVMSPYVKGLSNAAVKINTLNAGDLIIYTDDFNQRN